MVGRREVVERRKPGALPPSLPALVPGSTSLTAHPSAPVGEEAREVEESRAVCRRCWGPCPAVCALCSPHLLRPIVPSGSLSLSFLPLTPFSGLACRFSDPRAPPLPSGCAWVVPAPLLITALFLIDLSYLGSVVETSLSSAQ